MLNPANDQASTLIYVPIALPEPNWILGIVVSEALMARGTLRDYRLELGLVLATLTAIALGAMLLCHIERFGDFQWNALSAIVAGVGIVGIGLIWAITGQRPSDARRDDEIPIGNLVQLDRFLQAIASESDLALPDPSDNPKPYTILPTGIWIGAIEFENANNIQIHGRIWQRYTNDQWEALDPETLFPEIILFPDVAPDPEAVAIDPITIYQNGDDDDNEPDGDRIFVASFRVTLRQDFNYNRFPFDAQEIIIRLKHRAVDQTVFLVPDANSYERLDPSSRPGLSPDLVLPGWQVRSSGFRYRLTQPGVTFGLPRDATLSAFPDLCLAIRIRRQILNPFVTYLIPIAVVLTLLYGVLFSMTKIEGKCSIAGFNTFDALDLCAAFIFVIVIAHGDMRSRMLIEDLTYLEYLYFITYTIILLVAANAIVFTTTDSVAWIEYRDNQIAKTLYWPVFCLLALIASLILLA